MYDPNEWGSLEMGTDSNGNMYSAYTSWTHPERSYDTRNVPDDAPVPHFCNGDCESRIAALEAEMAKLKTPPVTNDDGLMREGE